MGIPRVVTVCDKCQYEHITTLEAAKPYSEIMGKNKLIKHMVDTKWLPNGWGRHDTQDGDGPEPEKFFILCVDCEYGFQKSVREWQPNAKDKV